MNEDKKGFFKKIALLLSAVGPGLFLIGYNIGTGSITTMASAGSRYGMSLFWTLVLSCLFTFVMLIAYGHYTAVTGETAMVAFKRHIRFGKSLAIFTIIGLIIGELSALIGIMAIVTTMVNEWTTIVLGIPVSTVAVAVVVMIGSYILLWDGKYEHFEKFLIILVIIMGAGFLGSMFLVVPQPAELLAGLKPSIPDHPDAFLIVAGMTGTTCSAMVFIMRSIVIAEKGWKREHLKQEKIDALVSSGMMLLLSASVMACAAGTLYKMGQPVEQAIDMVKTLEPLAGRFAISLFVLGVIGAGISTLFPIVLIAPWLISDYRGSVRNLRTPLYRILGAFGLLLGLTIPVFGGRPVWVMVASQAFQSLLLPLITLPIIYLLNSRKLMGDDRAGFWMNLGLWATLIFALITAWTGVLGLKDMIL